ncbi:hypothetical protein LXL04_006719 [Taraxacum kok-saghyz]
MIGVEFGCVCRDVVKESMASATEEPLHPRTVAVPLKTSPLNELSPIKRVKLFFHNRYTRKHKSCPTNPLDAYRILMYQARIRGNICLKWFDVDDYNLGYFVTIHAKYVDLENDLKVFDDIRLIDSVSPPDRKGEFAKEAWDAVVAKCLWVELEDMVVYSTVNGQMSMFNGQQCTPLDLYARSATTDNPLRWEWRIPEIRIGPGSLD